MSTIDLVTLRQACEREAAESSMLFRSLGGWVGDTGDPQLQRTLATAAHRVAWHASLWRDRFPVVQQMDPRHEPAVADLEAATDDARRSVALASVSATLERLAELGERVDSELDPSTRRVIDLTAADLVEIAGLLDA